jgi:two-component system OmpR family sensor kinase
MSLRARLLAGLLTLAAAGLLALGAITYAEQRSFLLDRVDRQAQAAVPTVEHALGQRGVRGSAPAPRDTDGDARGGPPGGDGPRDVSLPPGTYGELHNAAGKSLGSVTLSYGQQSLSKPKLPSNLAAGNPTTVSSGDDGVRYRVLASSRPGGTVVVAVPMREVDQTLDRLVKVEALVIGAVLLALAALAWWVVQIGLRPLDRMGATADAIAAGDLSRRVEPATERTEVGRLGMALNAMLGQIERAFAQQQKSEDRLRRFLADASHELRTPLSSIRGYAELFRMGAVSGEADSDKAINRIEEEAARMGVLVEDLLTLARLDEVRDPTRVPVDLVDVARDTVDDTRAAAPTRPIELNAADSTTVMGDAHQLHQVLTNLVRNALVHTPSGTAIELTVTRADGYATVEVRDHGPGLPSDDGNELFERFWRADPGRHRGRAGAGLGLAIVAAIVGAHGGRVEAENAPGGGASFRVHLPLVEQPSLRPAPAPV